jgi:hypothetical protein
MAYAAPKAPAPIIRSPEYLRLDAIHADACRAWDAARCAEWTPDKAARVEDARRRCVAAFDAANAQWLRDNGFLPAAEG